MTAPDRAQQRALDEIVEIVEHARPQLVDAFDATALVESLGYTDDRIRREVGLPDARALGAYVFERLEDRALPVPAPTYAEGIGVRAPRRGVVAVTAMLIGWVATVVATRMAATPITAALPFAFIASIVLWGGVLDAIRRRGAFYLALDQPRIARITCWYFVRLAAMLSLVLTAAGFVVALLAGVAWPLATVWVDETLALCAVWAIVGALQVPGALSLRRNIANAAVVIPRMTIVAFNERRALLLGPVMFLLACSPRFISAATSADALVAILLVTAVVLLRRLTPSASTI
jgi:hypothetical protein